MLLILAPPKVTLCPGYLMLPKRLPQDLVGMTLFVTFMGSVDQEFGWSAVGMEMACLCSMMSGVEDGRLESWRLEPSVCRILHSYVWQWMLAIGWGPRFLSFDLDWASLAWCLGY